MITTPALAGTILDVGDVFVDSRNALFVGLPGYGVRVIDGASDGPYSSITLAGTSSNPTGSSRIQIDHGGSLASLGDFAIATTGFRAELSVRDASTLETDRLLVGGAGGAVSNGGGLVLIEGGSTVTSREAEIVNSWAPSSITVSGPGSRWINSGRLFERANLGNAISVVDGGYLSTGSMFIASDYARTQLLVSGVGSIWETGDLMLRTRFSSDDLGGPNGGLRVLNGGMMRSSNVTMTTQTLQTAFVRGPGSRWIVTDTLRVSGNGAGGDSRISVEDGGYLESGRSIVSATGGHEWIAVTGSGSVFHAGELSILGTPDEGQTAAVHVHDGALMRTDDVSISNCGQARGPGCLLSVEGEGARWIASGSVSVAATESGIAEVAVGPGSIAEVRDNITIGFNSSLTLDHGAVSGNRVDLAEGRLRGTGVIFGDVRAGGRVDPGDTASEVIGGLLIHGAYVQEDSGVLSIQLGGATPGVEHDVLAVIGTSFLGGALHVQLANGYIPRLGESFNILASASVSGEFASYQGLQVSPTVNLQVDYLPFGVRLTAVPEPGTAILLGLGLSGLVAMRGRMQ